MSTGSHTPHAGLPSLSVEEIVFSAKLVTLRLRLAMVSCEEYCEESVGVYKVPSGADPVGRRKPDGESVPVKTGASELLSR